MTESVMIYEYMQFSSLAGKAPKSGARQALSLRLVILEN